MTKLKVCRRRTRRQLWRDRLRRVNLEDFERGPLLGIGGFGRWDVFEEGGAVDDGGDFDSFWVLIAPPWDWRFWQVR